MKAFKGAATFLLLLSLAALPVSAHCYEALFKVTDGEQLISIPVTVLEREGGGLVDSAETMRGVMGYNFFIDYVKELKSPSCTGVNVVNLEENTEYVLRFHYPDALGGVKSLCFVRYGCFTSYDTFYEVDQYDVTKVEGSCEELYWGYPNCEPIPAPPDIAVSLRIIDIEEIGDKIVFYLRATASGGDGTYLFAWDGASRISPTAYTNPNLAKRTILRSQSTVVTVTVTSDGESVEKSIELSGDRIP